MRLSSFQKAANCGILGTERYRTKEVSEMSYSFYAMLARMKYIHRWSLMRNTRMETVSEHTEEVALLSHALAVLTNTRFHGQVDPGNCVLLALYHDAPEILTGDLPTPVKYHDPQIRQAFQSVEDMAAGQLLRLLPEDLRPAYEPFFFPEGAMDEERRIVKAADKLSALIKCIEELQQGNTEFITARATLEQAVRELQLPAADCFLREFLPAYTQTLDEQQNGE